MHYNIRPATDMHFALQDLLSQQASLPLLALAGLSDIINPSLAREVNQDVITLLTHSRPQVGKV